MVTEETIFDCCKPAVVPDTDPVMDGIDKQDGYVYLYKNTIANLVPYVLYANTFSSQEFLDNNMQLVQLTNIKERIKFFDLKYFDDLGIIGIDKTNYDSKYPLYYVYSSLIDTQIYNALNGAITTNVRKFTEDVKYLLMPEVKDIPEVDIQLYVTNGAEVEIYVGTTKDDLLPLSLELVPDKFTKSIAFSLDTRKYKMIQYKTISGDDVNVDLAVRGGYLVIFQGV